MNLMSIYKALLEHFGKQDWWPVDEDYHKKVGSDKRVEIIVGAILTQNTAWRNVEKCIEEMKAKRMLDIKRICELDIEKLEHLIKSSGFYRQKAKRLKDFMCYIKEKYNADLNKIFSQSDERVREELISIKGIGFETADSILLYAANKPFFIVDAYTIRFLKRFGIPLHGNYESIRKGIEKRLRKDVEIYKEFHALIVELCKQYCKKVPRCDACPLSSACKHNLP